jgi:hypothetical protein
MRFVATKTPEQQSCLMLHRTRHLFIRHQTSVINALRAHLAEFGIVAPVGRNGVEQLLDVNEGSDKTPAQISEEAKAFAIPNDHQPGEASSKQPDNKSSALWAPTRSTASPAWPSPISHTLIARFSRPAPRASRASLHSASVLKRWSRCSLSKVAPQFGLFAPAPPPASSAKATLTAEEARLAIVT